MIELLLAVMVGSIVLAGVYASYTVIAIQFQKNAATAEIRDFALPTLKIISRDLRMAGYRAVDNNITSTYGKIDPPIAITDVSGACCDSISVTYDKSLTNRVKVTYYVAARNNPPRNALYMNIDSWDGSNWINTTNAAIVADYVVDFQIEGKNLNSSGYPTLINYNIVFQSRDKTKTQNTFTKSSYGAGNNDGYSVTDYYMREEFDSSVVLRNISQ